MSKIKTEEEFNAQRKGIIENLVTLAKQRVSGLAEESSGIPDFVRAAQAVAIAAQTNQLCRQIASVNYKHYQLEEVQDLFEMMEKEGAEALRHNEKMQCATTETIH